MEKKGNQVNEKSRMEEIRKALKQEAKAAETENLFEVKQERRTRGDADLERVRSALASIEKARKEQQEAYQELLRNFQDAESKILTLEKELDETKTNKLKMESDLRAEIARLKADNDRQQNLLAKYLHNPASQNGRDALPPTDLAPISIRKKGTDLGMLEPLDQSKLCNALIWDLQPQIAVHHLPGLPAYIIFMCIRYMDHLNDDNKVRSFLTDAITVVKKLMRKKGESDMKVSVLWLSNVLRLLHTLKQYSGDAMYQTGNTPKQNKQSLKNFDLSEYRQVLSDIAVWIYSSIIKLLEDKIQPLIVPAILHNDSGIVSQASTSISSEPGTGGITKPLDKLLEHLEDTVTLLQSFGLDPQVIQQVFTQLFYYISARTLNNLLSRKVLCNRFKGTQIQCNIFILEEWCRENKMNPEVTASLQPIIQAYKLLQAKKAEKNVNSLCEMCDKLTIDQVVKILYSYTPADEFEQGLPTPRVVQLVQNRLEEIRGSSKLGPQASTGINLLMDTKYIFPVEFPFNPSTVRLEDIEIPEAFNISHLVKRL